MLARVQQPWDTTGSSGLSKDYLSLGQQLACSAALGFTKTRKVRHFPLSFVRGLRLCWKSVLDSQHVQYESLSLPGGAGSLRRISNLLSVAAGTDGVKDLFRGGDPQVLRANPCKSTLLIAKQLGNRRWSPSQELCLGTLWVHPLTCRREAS